MLRKLEIRPVLEFMNYRLDTIQETDRVFRCFCPIHREEVLRTLTIDKKTSNVKCSFANCPGRDGVDLIEFRGFVAEDWI